MLRHSFMKGYAPIIPSNRASQPKPEEVNLEDFVIKRPPKTPREEPANKPDAKPLADFAKLVVTPRSSLPAQASLAENQNIPVQNSAPTVRHSLVPKFRVRQDHVDVLEKAEPTEEIKQAAKQGKKRSSLMCKSSKGNFVATNLRGKYRERFVGELGRIAGKVNRRRLSFKFYEKKAPDDEKRLMASSLSSSFCMDIDMSKEQEQNQDRDLAVFEMVERIREKGQFSREELLALTREVFGFEQFRFGQFEAVSSLLKAESVLFISETGSGKSLSFYLAAMLLEGLALVVSPLVSLMQDQLKHLPTCISAACISGALHRGQIDEILGLARRKQLDLLFLTPESFLRDFACQMRQLPAVSFVCIDEVHCLSEHSHNFRYAYSMLIELIAKYVPFEGGKQVILGLTATSNSQTKTQLQAKLKVKKSIQAESLRRANLKVTVSRDRNRLDGLVKYLSQPELKPLQGVLVYTRSKYFSSIVQNVLSNSGFRSACYNSDINQVEKVELIRKFLSGRLAVLVTTVALGMGVDFANVKCVVHMNMPKTIQNYVQEIGRAGRNPSLQAYCHLFLDDADYIVQRNFALSTTVQYPAIARLIHLLRQNSPKRLSASEEAISTRLCAVPIVQVTTEIDLPVESVHSLMIRLQRLTESTVFRCQPSCPDTCQVKFYTKPFAQVKEQSSFIKQLAGCGYYKNGALKFGIIAASNFLHLEPMELLFKLREQVRKHGARYETKGQLIVWRVSEDADFQIPQSKIFKLVEQLKQLHQNILVKVQCMFTLARLHSSATLQKAREARDVALEFDQYFGRPSKAYYDWLLERAGAQEYGVLPVSELDQQQIGILKSQVAQFFRLEIQIQKESKTVHEILRQYSDGVVLTRILMGIGTVKYPQSTWKNNQFWKNYDWADFDSLLGRVRPLCEEQTLLLGLRQRPSGKKL